MGVGGWGLIRIGILGSTVEHDYGLAILVVIGPKELEGGEFEWSVVVMML